VPTRLARSQAHLIRARPYRLLCRTSNESPLASYGAAMAQDLKHPATGDLIVLAVGEQLWRIGWPGAPVLVITKNGPDGNALYRLADPKCKTWNKLGDMKLVPWPEADS
jgi:hypothetical protein